MGLRVTWGICLKEIIPCSVIDLLVIIHFVQVQWVLYGSVVRQRDCNATGNVFGEFLASIEPGIKQMKVPFDLNEREKYEEVHSILKSLKVSEKLACIEQQRPRVLCTHLLHQLIGALC